MKFVKFPQHPNLHYTVANQYDSCIPYLDSMIHTTDVTIGFINPPYSVIENEGQVVIQVGVIGGLLQRETVVTFSTRDSTAIGNLVALLNKFMHTSIIVIQMELIILALQICCLYLTLSPPLLMFQSLSCLLYTSDAADE